MCLAPACMISLPKFNELSWFHDWKNYWIEHRFTYANGCSDINLPDYLSDTNKVQLFRQFIQQYTRWVETFGLYVTAEQLNGFTSTVNDEFFTAPYPTDKLTHFANKVIALLDSDLSHPSLQKIGPESR